MPSLTVERCLPLPLHDSGKTERTSIPCGDSAKTFSNTPRSEASLEILHRAAFVFVAACWESYIEDVATEAFDFLLQSAVTPDIFPAKVRVLASRHLLKDKDERRIWELVTGWKDILKAHRQAILEVSLWGFNTPKTRQVRELFGSLLDLDLPSKWVLPRLTAEQSASSLDDYMTIRGNIAYRAKHCHTLHKKTGNNQRPRP